MKAFEEWLETSPIVSTEVCTERGWRGALERALEAGQEAGLEHFVPVSWIKKELDT